MIRFIFFLGTLSMICSCVSTTEPERPIRTQDSLAILDSLPDTLFLRSLQAIHTKDTLVLKDLKVQVTDTLVLKPKFSPTTYRYTVKGCSWALRPYYPRLSKSMVIYDSSYSTEEATAAYMRSTEPIASDSLKRDRRSRKKPLIEQDTAYFQLPDPYTLQLWMIEEPDTSYWVFLKDFSTDSDSLTGPPLFCESCPCSVSLTTHNHLQMQPVTYTFSTPKS